MWYVRLSILLNYPDFLGTMGIAILSGVMASLRESSEKESGMIPEKLPKRFIACVRRQASQEKVESSLTRYSDMLTTYVNNNVKALEEADVILLSCKPQMVKEILSEPGIVDAIAGKLLVSILAGVPVEQIEDILYGSSFNGDVWPDDRCRIVRAMPNTASFVRESMTVIATTTHPLPQSSFTLLTWMFSQIGRVVHLPPSAMDACTAICGSGPAFMALVLEAIADGAVAMGLPRSEAQMMAAQTMRGTTGLVLNGEHPAILRDKVSTPGGCTIGGLLVIEEGRVRGTLARAIREATTVASMLGQGMQGVNGTRF